MRFLPLLATSAALAASIAPSTAAAQRAQSAEEDRSRANVQRLFREATAAYDSFDNERALALFQRLYQLTEDPPLLVNVASVLVRLHRDQDAISAWQRFLESGPSSSERASIEGLIRDARARIEQARAASPNVDPQRSAPSAQTSQSADRSPPSQPAQRSTEVTERVGPGAGPWVVLGLGAGVAASAAIPFFAVRGAAIQELSAAGCDPFHSTVCDPSLREAYDRAQAASAASIALVSVGGAAIVAGALWGALGGRTERRTVIVTGWIDPSQRGAGVTVTMGAL